MQDPDTPIAEFLTTLADQLTHDESQLRSRLFRSIQAGQMSDAAYHLLDALVDSPASEELMRAIVSRVIGIYLWEMSVLVDERREVGGHVLRLGLGSGEKTLGSRGSLHERVMGAMVRQGIEF